MNYKNLLVLHCLHDPISSLRPAVAMTKDLHAHLEIRVLNLASHIPTMALTQDPHYDWTGNFADLLGETEKRVGDVKKWLEDEGVDATVSSSCQQLGLVADDVAAPALYADLVMCHRCDESLVSGLMAKALEGAIFDAGKPALILSQQPGSGECEFKSVSIAWDPVPEAMKALSASLPLLQKASDIELLIVSKNADKEPYTAATKKIIVWLRRHEITAKLNIIDQGDQPVSRALISYINGTDRDLVVMGAYGHTKFSERLFSGVSHTVLDKANTSLFIAH